VTIEYLDRPPQGWFVFEVMRKKARKSDWIALMVDVDPDDLPGKRTARQFWFDIPGKHRSRDAAWGALQDVIATRH
jgi:hypothetical protein